MADPYATPLNSRSLLANLDCRDEPPKRAGLLASNLRPVDQEQFDLKTGVRKWYLKESTMKRSQFFVGQKWAMKDSLYGTFFGEVIEAADNGQSGVVIITDEKDNVLDTFSGRVADFQASGEWQSVDWPLNRHSL